MSPRSIPYSPSARGITLLRKPPAVHPRVKFRTYEADYVAVLLQCVYFTFDECNTFALKHCAPASPCSLASYEIPVLPRRQRDQPLLFISATREANDSQDNALASLCPPVGKTKGLALMLQFSLRDSRKIHNNSPTRRWISLPGAVFFVDISVYSRVE